MLRLTAFLCLHLLLLILNPANAQQSTPKNIILIVLDDADYFDVEYNNGLLTNPDSVTPNIKWLSENGKVFTEYYSASALCSATRASILTGLNPIRLGIVDAWPQIDSVVQRSSGMGGVSKDIPQLGSLMKSLGKKTGHFGKWHVGLSRKRYGHRALGFQEFTYHKRLQGYPYVSWGGEYEFKSHSGDRVIDVTHVDRFFTEEVLNFIDEYHAHENGFYINFWPLSPHFPWTPPDDFDYSKLGFDEFTLTNRQRVLSMMFSIDEEIGKVISKLREKGIFDDTLFIVTSDNGNVYRVQNEEHYYRGGKGALYDGGLKVPFVAHWPNGIEGNTSNDSVMVSYDLLPTFLEIIGADSQLVEVLPFIDGRSKAPAFFTDEILEHDPIFWQIAAGKTRVEDDQSLPTYALRVGNYKIVKPERRNPNTHANAFFLFDLTTDPREITNLYRKEPELALNLRKQLFDYRKDMSRFSAIPEAVRNERVNVPFDPRLDITSKDLTLMFDLTIPDTLERWNNIYYKPGSVRLILFRNKQLGIRITGVNSNGRSSSRVFRTERLSSGTHRITLVIGGYKGDFSKALLYVNNELVFDIDNLENPNDLLALWSTVSDVSIGDLEIEMTNLRYHTIRLWPEEWY